MRSRVERGLHVVACLVLAWLVWQCVRSGAGGVEVVEQRALRAALVRWSTGDGAPAVHVRVVGVLGAVERDWLRAVRGAGHVVTWDHPGAQPLPATAIDAEAVADPRGMIRVSAAGPVGSRVVLADRLGRIDSATACDGIVAFRVPSPVVAVRATVDSVTSVAGSVDSLVLKRVLVLARAGWEGKFIARALTDEGWGVDVHFVVAPKNDVVSAAMPAVDTAHYAAVVAVDSGIGGPIVRAVADYVKSGGGLVIGARDMAGVEGLAPATVGAVIRGASTLVDTVPRRGLTLVPMRIARDSGVGAVALERRDALVAVAARRVGTGRVVAVGYTDSWRWRMEGGDSGAVGHRAWWAHLVASVAYAPAAPRASVVEADPAPLAGMVSRLGPPRPVPLGASESRAAMLPAWAFAVIVAAVVLEWASRRMRGQR